MIIPSLNFKFANFLHTCLLKRRLTAKLQLIAFFNAFNVLYVCIMYTVLSLSLHGDRNIVFLCPRRHFSNKHWNIVFNICSKSRFLTIIVAACRSCAVRSAFAMERPRHPGSLRLFLDRLLASRLGVFSLTLIIVGCVIIATVSWHTALVAWPREEERLYANREAKQPITGNGTANQSNSGYGTVNQSIVGDRTVDQSAATCP